MPLDKSPKLDHISLRFNELEQGRLAARLDPSKKVRSQIKELIFRGIKSSPSPSLESRPGDLQRLEAMFSERTERIIGLLGMLVSRIESLEEQLSAIGVDAARSKAVVENIQDYLHDEQTEQG